MSFPRYPSYKQTGVEWLGEIPTHWFVKPMKYLVTFRSGGTPDKSQLSYWEGTIPWASAKDLKSEWIRDTQDHITQQALDDGAAELVEAGSLLVVVRGMILAHSFPVATALTRLAINQDLKALTPRDDISADYLAWLLRGSREETLSRLDEAGHGTKALRMEAWSAMNLPLPPLAEQSAIAAFLSAEANKIDALITDQNRLIQLLKEKRQADDSHAVTRGLNPSTAFKPSGDAWLRDVPSEWRVVPLKYLATIDNSGCFGVEPELGRIRLPVATTAQITPQGLFNVSEMPVRGFSDEEIQLYRCEARDILVVKSSGSASNIISGKAGLVTEKTPRFVFSNFLMRVRPSVERVNAMFLFLLLTSALTRARVERMCSTTTYPNLDVPEYSSAVLPVPSLEEQEDIVAQMENRRARIDQLIEESGRVNALLHERRAAMISAAVTGKVDVRGLTPAANA